MGSVSDATVFVGLVALALAIGSFIRILLARYLRRAMTIEVGGVKIMFKKNTLSDEDLDRLVSEHRRGLEDRPIDQSDGQEGEKDGRRND